jgi:hypothetical protein
MMSSCYSSRCMIRLVTLLFLSQKSRIRGIDLLCAVSSFSFLLPRCAGKRSTCPWLLRSNKEKEKLSPPSTLRRPAYTGDHEEVPSRGALSFSPFPLELKGRSLDEYGLKSHISYIVSIRTCKKAASPVQPHLACRRKPIVLADVLLAYVSSLLISIQS